MFLEIQAGVARNVYEGAAAPPDAPDGSIQFVPVADYATAMTRVGMTYQDGVFTDTAESRARTAPPASNKVSKTAFLAAIGPDLLAAWFASADPVLVFGREMFRADTSVDIDNAVIAQVVTQGVKLGLVTPAAAAAVQSAILALAPT